MKELIQWLHSYGLNKTELTVYLAVLKHPHAKTADVQRDTGLVRTTLYYSLAELKSKGLISENLQNNVKTYETTDTSVLRNEIETVIQDKQRRLHELTTLQPVFEALSSTPPAADTHIARYEGIYGVKQAIEHAMRSTSKKWVVVAARDNFLRHMPKAYQQYYLEERKRRGITVKTLWEPIDNPKIPTAEDIFYRNPRRLPEQFRGMFQSLVILYDDTTLIVDSYEQKTAHAIKSEQSTKLLRMLLEHVWTNAETIN